LGLLMGGAKTGVEPAVEEASHAVGA
jgi:hypothetical protein